jgi:GntR family transcriptional regulator
LNQARRLIVQPLHEQMKAVLLERIDAGEWSPGTYLPSEARLAEEYGVSVGTLRTALNALAAEGILVRRQGKGTAVAMHDADATLFRFFALRRPDGTRVLPVSEAVLRTRRIADAEEAADLALTPGSEIIYIERTRDIEERKVIFESISLSARRFEALLDVPKTLPNTLYQLYQKDFGVTVIVADEHLSAVGAEPMMAKHLLLPVGAPVLRIHRIARDLQGNPVERRLSFVATDGLIYKTRL